MGYGTKTVTGKNSQKEITLKIGDNTAFINKNAVKLDVAASIIDSRTFVPLRFVAEALNCQVNWFGDESCVTVYSKNYAGTKKGMAELKSNVHRNVPTEFELSKDLNDIYHEERPSIKEQEKAYAILREKGEMVCDNNEFMQEFSVKGEQYGSYEIVDVKDISELLQKWLLFTELLQRLTVKDSK